MTEISAPAPWHCLYASGVEPFLEPPEASVLAMFVSSVASDPHAPALHYFGRTLSRRELARYAWRLSWQLRDLGVGAGGRVAVSLQNTPMFAVALLAAWGVGASVVPVNPMLRPGELAHLLQDSGAQVLIAHPLMSQVIDQARDDLACDLPTLWSDPDDLAGDIPLPFMMDIPTPPSGDFVLDVIEAEGRGECWVAPAPGTAALITYTSGTTGPSKGAVGTHANLAFQAVNYAQWFEVADDTSILTIAPFFHITGLGAHLAFALGNGLPMVMTYRFEPLTVLRLIEHHRPTFALGAITAFISLLESRSDSGAVLSQLRTVFSGGAAVPAKVVDRFEKACGVYIHNIYGLTESTSACIAVPRGRRAPTETKTGALSVGVPMGGTTVHIVDNEGREVPAGVEGEIVVSGPQVVPEYLSRPAESASTFRPEGLYTGDIGVMDDQGWIYVVDRKKDLIVVSGYKVWPRDVEDVLYRHHAVKEVAVVGVPDDYRGESVQAFVTLRPGTHSGADASNSIEEELRLWCKEHLSAYKVPTEILVFDELPKTASGKILRRALRAELMGPQSESAP
ncbi:class I adenylate-forming enzyme family protein [Rhodococcus sp. NPDC059968]|uniref:class I adenylate-forming enzyme family protein n=1 Tax=Rhodococcus sp. NPDC059968 TaxID=3347017 RepID=UPI00366BA641